MTRMPKAKTVKPESNLLERFIPVLLLVSIALAFAVGVLWQKVSQLEKGGTANVAGTAGAGNVANTQPSAPQGPTEGKLTEDQIAKIPEVSSLTLDKDGKKAGDVQVSTDDHFRGSKSATVFLVEYSDFQCPFCGQFHPTVQRVLQEYKDQVALIYRHFPLDAIHPNARPAAEASECIADLGGENAFWKFTDEVFANQQTALTDLAATAEKVGINKSSFQSCFSAGKYKDKVEKLYQGGLAAGVNGTPGTFIINKKGEAWLVPGALPYDSVKPMIDEALKS